MNRLAPIAVFSAAIGLLYSQTNPRKPPVLQRTMVVEGVDRTGKTDARAAIQRDLDAVAALGGGVIHIPRGTYLLDSYRPSTHPWKFYNLRVPSHVTLEGEPGTVLLQGPHGRAPLPERADHVENNVVAVGSTNYQAVTFQNPSLNGGFLVAHPTLAETPTVTLADPADGRRFKAGDYIVVYAGATGDVIESEPTEVVSVASGVLTLAHRLARSFPQAFVVNVTKLATAHVSLRNLTIQGAVPLAATEAFDLSLSDCRLVYDNAGGGSNLVTGMTVNTVRGFQMENGSIEPARDQFAGVELPQRNSQDVVFENVTIKVSNVMFGEYAAHWKLLRNRFWIHPDATTTAGIAIAGLDVEFAQNAVHGDNLTAGGGSGALLADMIGPSAYSEFVGQIRLLDNIIDCRADGNNCVRLTTRDPAVDRNRITATGFTTGIKVEGAAGKFSITNNLISTENHQPALVLDVFDLSGAAVRGNSLSGSGAYAIVIGGRPSRSDCNRIGANNTISGFTAPLHAINGGSN